MQTKNVSHIQHMMVLRRRIKKMYILRIWRIENHYGKYHNILHISSFKIPSEKMKKKITILLNFLLTHADNIIRVTIKKYGPPSQCMLKALPFLGNFFLNSNNKLLQFNCKYLFDCDLEIAQITFLRYFFISFYKCNVSETLWTRY